MKLFEMLQLHLFLRLKNECNNSLFSISGSKTLPFMQPNITFPQHAPTQGNNNSISSFSFVVQHTGLYRHHPYDQACIPILLFDFT